MSGGTVSVTFVVEQGSDPLLIGGYTYIQTANPVVYAATGVLTIAPNAFASYTELLTNVSFFDGVTGILENAFENCIILEDIIFYNTNILTIGNRAFAGCTALTNISLPSLLETIGNNSFEGCINLTKVNGTDSISEIGTGVFNNCVKLATLYTTSNTNTLYNYFSTNLPSVNIIINSITLYFLEPQLILKLGNFLFNGFNNFTVLISNETTINTITNGLLKNLSQLSSTILSDSVTTIELNAFKNCVNLTTIKTYPNLLTINEFAFEGCTSLTNIDLAFTITSIGANAFKDCSNLVEIELPTALEVIQAGTFNGCTKLESITVPNTITISNNAFLDCIGLTTVTFVTILGSPITDNTIGFNSFKGCTSLETITIPASFLSIGASAFEGSGLKTITLPESITLLAEVFSGLTSLTDVTFSGNNPNYLENTIGSNVFNGCTGLTSITIPSSFKSIGANAFQNSGITSIVLPETITLGNGIFTNLTNLTSITFSGNNADYTNNTIGVNAFKGCSNLTTITIPSAIASIGQDAFLNSGITSIILPETITLGNGIFTNLTNLTSVTFSGNNPDYINNIIGANAFYGCSNLTTITIPSAIGSIGGGAFQNSGITSITLPETITLDNIVFDGLSSLTSVIFSGNNSIYRYNTFGSSVFRYCSGLTTITIPSTIGSIGNNAFEGSGLTSIILPETVSLGDRVFANLATLTSVTFSGNNPDYTNNTIGEYTFSNCTGLTTISIPEPFVSFGFAAFYNSPNITSITLPNTLTTLGNYSFAGLSSLTTIDLPPNIETLSAYCFSSSGLISINLPTNLKIIDSECFRYCGTLASITFPEGLEQIKTGAFTSCNGLTVINIPASVNFINVSFPFAGNIIKYIVDSNNQYYCSDAYGVLYGYEYDSDNLKTGNIYIESYPVGRLDDTYTIETPLVINGDTLNITKLKSGSFSLSRINYLYIGEGVEVLETNTFGDTRLVDIYLPSTIKDAGSIEAGGSIANSTSLRNIFVDPENVNYSSNNGYSWNETNITTGNYNFVTESDGRCSASNAAGSIYYSSNGGVSWVQTNQTTGTFVNLASRNQYFIAASNDGNGLLTSINYGESWSASNITSGNYVATIDKFGPNRVALAVSSSIPGIIASYDGGQGWTNTNKNDNYFNCVSIYRLTGVVGSSDNTGIWYSFDNGNFLRDWLQSNVSTGNFDNIFLLDSHSVASSTTSGLWYSVNGGANWVQTNITSGIFTSLFMVSNYAVAASTSGIYYSANNGASWTQSTFTNASLVSGSYKSISMFNNIAIAGSNDNTGIIYSYDYGNQWYVSAVTTGNFESVVVGSNMVAGSNSNTGLLCLTYGVLLEEIENGQAVINYTIGNTRTIYNFTNTTINVAATAFYNSNNLRNINMNNLEIITHNAFANCVSLDEIFITKSVKQIETDTFVSCFAPTLTFEYDNSITTPYLSIFGRAFYGCSGLTNVTVPKSVKGFYNWDYNTYELGSNPSNAFINCTSLASITISSYLENIGSNVFENCPNLTSVIFTDDDGGNGLTMEYRTFYNNSSITNIVLTNTLKVIGNNSFEGCTGLTTITIPGSVTNIKENAFSGCTGLLTVIFESGTGDGMEIGVSAFKNLSNITTLTLENIKTIGSSAFEACTGITTITIPSTVTSIGPNAFKGCTNLATVIFEARTENLTIDASAFEGCTSITTITISNTVTSIGANAFNGCINLATITFETGASKNLVIGENAFDSCPVTVLTLNRVSSIGLNAFNNCVNLQTINITDESCSLIGEGTFNGCTNLETVNINGNNLVIGNNAFKNLSTINNISLSNVLSIGNSCFEGCSDLTSISIPSTCSSIGSNAFKGCSNLATVAINGSNITIGDNAFLNLNALNSITLSNILSIGISSFEGCANIPSIIIPETCRFIGDYAFKGCSLITTITIPSACEIVGKYAFMNCSSLETAIINCSDLIDEGAFKDLINLTSITLTNVKIIGSLAFYGTGISTVIIPDSVTYITSDVFVNCDNIESYTVDVNNQYYYSDVNGVLYSRFNTGYMIIYTLFQYPVANPLTIYTVLDDTTELLDYSFYNSIKLVSIILPETITTIGESTFEGCVNLVNVNIPSKVTIIPSKAFFACENVPEFNIPINVTEIGEAAFSNCKKITSILIPNSVNVIQDSAFSDCDLNSLSIYKIPQLGNNIFSNNDNLNTVNIIPSNPPTDISQLLNQIVINSSFSLGNPTYSDPSVLANSENIVCLSGSNTDILITGNGNDVNVNTPLLLSKSKSTTKAVGTASSNKIYNVIIQLLNTSASSRVFGGITYTRILNSNYYGTQDAIEEIPDDSFNNTFANNNLLLVCFSNKIKSIGIRAFKNCTKLETPVFTYNLTTIRREAFWGCLKFNLNDTTVLEIPQSVSLIGSDAFNSCTNLRYLKIYNPEIGTNIFANCFTNPDVTKSIYLQNNPIISSNLTKVQQYFVNINVAATYFGTKVSYYLNPVELGDSGPKLYLQYNEIDNSILYTALGTDQTQNILLKTGQNTSGFTSNNITNIIEYGLYSTLYDNIVTENGIPSITGTITTQNPLGGLNDYAYYKIERLLLGANRYRSITYGYVNVYGLNNNYNSPVLIGTYAVSDEPICFKEDTKILYFNKETNKEEYIKVQDLNKGDLVKTYKNGFLPIVKIGFAKIFNSGTSDRLKDKLYKYTNSEYPEIFEDLFITGGHSILVDKLTEYESNETNKVNGKITKIHDKFSLLSYLNLKSTPHTKKDVFTIWNFSLDDVNTEENYGVYANGLLVEACPYADMINPKFPIVFKE